jgi:VanZ family protein
MPTPFVHNLAFVPRPLARLADDYDFLRNILGGFVLQAAILALGWGTFRRSDRTWVWTLPALILFSALEFAQRWLPERFSDWRDVVAAAIGIAVATFAARALVRPRTRTA